jgi:hypothetical protein
MDYSQQTNNFILFIHNFLCIGLQTIINKIKNFDYQQAGLRALTFYSETYEICKKNALIVYKIPYVKNTIDQSIYFVHSIICSLISQRIEPYERNWLCITALRTRMQLHLNNMEMYEKLNEDTSIQEHFLYSCSTAKSIVKYDSKIENSMITMKICDQYFTRSFSSKYSIGEEDTFDIETIKPFHNKFLSIEYTHPKMKKGTVMNLDKGYWNVGNHILSNVFVKRWLEYQNKPYHFDNQYTILILDGDVNVIKLAWDQKIVLLQNNSYEIIYQ